MDKFMEMIVSLLTKADGTGVAGVNHTEGDFGFDVGMMDGREFHIEVTQQ